MTTKTETKENTMTAANSTPTPAELTLYRAEQAGHNETRKLLEAESDRADALAAILAEAPHADNCPYGQWFIDDEAAPGGRTKQSFDCDCWKSKLPADALAARDARVAAAALRDAGDKMIDWEVVYGHEEGTPEQRESNSNAAWLHSEADRIEREAL